MGPNSHGNRHPRRPNQPSHNRNQKQNNCRIPQIKQRLLQKQRTQTRNSRTPHTRPKHPRLRPNTMASQIHQITQEIRNQLGGGPNLFGKKHNTPPTYLQEIVRKYLIQEHNIITRPRPGALIGKYKNQEFRIHIDETNGTINYQQLKQKQHLQDPNFDIQTWIDQIAKRIKQKARKLKHPGHPGGSSQQSS